MYDSLHQLRPYVFDKKDLIRRHLIILLMAAGFGFLNIIQADLPTSTSTFFREMFGNFLFIAVIWNGNMALLDVMDVFLKWDQHLRLKIILIIGIAIALPACVHFVFTSYVFKYVHNRSCPLDSKESLTYLIVSISITLMINAIFAAITFFTVWRKAIEEKEALKRSNLSAEFEALKNQINPHFLFNSLNTLSGLIEESPETAETFVHELANVYRYVLQQKDKELTDLADELTFVQSYLYLNKIRYGNHLQCHVNVSETCLRHRIVSLSLQMLLENCIKHNVISASKPLTIEIFCENNALVVANNFQAKTTLTEASGIGLQNIRNRYAYFTDQTVNVMHDADQFQVRIPLLAMA